MGHSSGNFPPPDRPTTPRQRRDSKPRGPVHSCEARATSPGFREVRYLNRDLTRRGAGTVTETPGPGQYNTRVPMRRGTTFAGPRPKCSRAATVRAFVASAATTAAVAPSSERAIGQARRAPAAAATSQGAWPSPPPVAAVSQRLSTPLMGKESPGPVYKLPSDFDLKLVNKKTFHPPRCCGARAKRQLPRGKGRGAALRGGQGATTRRLPLARRQLPRVADNSGGGGTAGTVLGVPVQTPLGRGFLLGIRADGMTFVRLPWGVLYSRGVLSRGNVINTTTAASLGDPVASNSEGRGTELLTTVQVDLGVDATPSEEAGRNAKCDAPQPQPTSEG